MSAVLKILVVGGLVLAGLALLSGTAAASEGEDDFDELKKTKLDDDDEDDTGSSLRA